MIRSNNHGRTILRRLTGALIGILFGLGGDLAAISETALADGSWQSPAAAAAATSPAYLL